MGTEWPGKLQGCFFNTIGAFQAELCFIFAFQVELSFNFSSMFCALEAFSVSQEGGGALL